MTSTLRSKVANVIWAILTLIISMIAGLGLGIICYVAFIFSTFWGTVILILCVGALIGSSLGLKYLEDKDGIA